MGSDWRSMFDKPYLGAWDLDGKDVTVTIDHVEKKELRNKSGADAKPVVFFKGTKKGFALNKTNGKAIAAMYGNDTRTWVGKRLTLYPAQTSFGPDTVDCVRVRPGIPTTEAAAIAERPVDEAMVAKQEAARDAAE